MTYQSQRFHFLPSIPALSAHRELPKEGRPFAQPCKALKIEIN